MMKQQLEEIHMQLMQDPRNNLLRIQEKYLQERIQNNL